MFSINTLTSVILYALLEKRHFNLCGCLNVNSRSVVFFVGLLETTSPLWEIREGMVGDLKPDIITT